MDKKSVERVTEFLEEERLKIMAEMSARHDNHFARAEHLKALRDSHKTRFDDVKIAVTAALEEINHAVDSLFQDLIQFEVNEQEALRASLKSKE